MRPKGLWFPIAGLWCMACGGFLLHVRIHPPTDDAINWFAVLVPAITATLVPVLFAYRKGMPWAYILNATSVVVGVSLMTWHSMTHWTRPVSALDILLHSTLADSLILLGKLPLAHMILVLWRDYRPERGAT